MLPDKLTAVNKAGGLRVHLQEPSFTSKAMRLPVISGIIQRRLLINFRVDPAVLGRLLPEPFRPVLVGGAGMAGICLIRLARVRPNGLPGWAGIGSENAAHRIAVSWERNGERHEGVYIPRRDTSSWLNVLAGGRLFPGMQHYARFRVAEHDDRFNVAIESNDRLVRLSLVAHIADKLPTGSVFASVAEASEFFRRGAIGYSVTGTPGVYDGLELESLRWAVEPLAVERVRSSFFDDPLRFPRASVEFDSALLMRGIEHRWHARESICGCGESLAGRAATEDTVEAGTIEG